MFITARDAVRISQEPQIIMLLRSIKSVHDVFFVIVRNRPVAADARRVRRTHAHAPALSVTRRII